MHGHRMWLAVLGATLAVCFLPGAANASTGRIKSVSKNYVRDAEGALSPAQRQAADDCVCIRRFATDYSRDATTRILIDKGLRAGGIGSTVRSQSRARIYDYARHGDFDHKFCATHPKICKATGACLVFAGASLSASLIAGDSEKTAARNATGACVQAWLSVWLIG